MTTYTLSSPFSLCFLWSILYVRLKDSSAETLPKLVKLCYIPHHSVWVCLFSNTKKVIALIPFVVQIFQFKKETRLTIQWCFLKTMQQGIGFEARICSMVQSTVNVFHYFARNGAGLPILTTVFLQEKSLQENECCNDSTTTYSTNFHYAKPQATPLHTITMKVIQLKSCTLGVC